jgi:hypothetical protein
LTEHCTASFSVSTIRLTRASSDHPISYQCTQHGGQALVTHMNLSASCFKNQRGCTPPVAESRRLVAGAGGAFPISDWVRTVPSPLHSDTTNKRASTYYSILQARNSRAGFRFKTRRRSNAVRLIDNYDESTPVCLTARV